MIEVEIKVRVTDEQAKALIEGAHFVSRKILKNEIYDAADYRLTTNGFWLRCRNGNFELKFPATKDGSFHIDAATPMHEVTDELEIRLILKLPIEGLMPDILQSAGYAVLYRFANTRQTYQKDGLTIDFDQADFGDLVYSVCEIETLVETEDQTDQALEKLYAFARQHCISTERAEGKLGYYIRVKNPAHYHALIHSLKHRV